MTFGLYARGVALAVKREALAKPRTGAARGHGIGWGEVTDLGRLGSRKRSASAAPMDVTDLEGRAREA